MTRFEFKQTPAKGGGSVCIRLPDRYLATLRDMAKRHDVGAGTIARQMVEYCIDEMSAKPVSPKKGAE